MKQKPCYLVGRTEGELGRAFRRMVKWTRQWVAQFNHEHRLTTGENGYLVPRHSSPANLNENRPRTLEILQAFNGQVEQKILIEFIPAQESIEIYFYDFSTTKGAIHSVKEIPCVQDKIRYRLRTKLLPAHSQNAAA